MEIKKCPECGQEGKTGYKPDGLGDGTLCENEFHKKDILYYSNCCQGHIRKTIFSDGIAYLCQKCKKICKPMKRNCGKVEGI